MLELFIRCFLFCKRKKLVNVLLKMCLAVSYFGNFIAGNRSRAFAALIVFVVLLLSVLPLFAETILAPGQIETLSPIQRNETFEFVNGSLETNEGFSQAVIEDVEVLRPLRWGGVKPF